MPAGHAPDLPAHGTDPVFRLAVFGTGSGGAAERFEGSWIDRSIEPAEVLTMSEPPSNNPNKNSY